jgi:hypothetical protein
MTHAEAFALNQWLSDYPAFMTYDEIIELMIGDEDEWTHELISVWQTVEHFTLRQVADFIDGTRHHFQCTVETMKQEGAFA